MSKAGRSDEVLAGVLLLAGAAALVVGVNAVLALVLQYVYGWLAASHGWAPMPFWVAFAAVFFVRALRAKVSTKS